MARLIRDAAPPRGSWELAGLGPSLRAASPDALAELSPEFRRAQVPGTVASALREVGEIDLGRPRDLDAEEWWYRCRFHSEPAPHVLSFGGLATLADVWLNGEHALSSANMFLSNEVRRTLRADNELLVRFRPLAAWLSEKRPRPRYKTRLVSHQQLRWARTTLLGRMPGWSPKVAPVGPFRPVLLERPGDARVESVDLTTQLEGHDGVVHVAAVAGASEDTRLESCALVIGQQRTELEWQRTDTERLAVSGTVRMRDVPLYWPHTHGPQPLYPAHLVIATRSGETSVGLGRLGFRTIELADDPSRFELLWNGTRIFCRGACWTTTDLFALVSTPEAYRRVLGVLRAAGLNMVRIPGTMFYEADEFYEACDELGILVWQDFMFANMDYPFADAAFSATVREEAEQVALRLQAHPSVAMFCGGSEVGQQAAMLGLPREQWYAEAYELVLGGIVRARCPGVPYVVNSPCGEPLPFTPSQGAAHYYGVGAYQRPMTDARLSEVKFASECLAFANVPDQDVLDELGTGLASVSHPKWKERVPRDAGASWDFDDVRDHYFQTFFRMSPVEVRYADPERYLAMSRVLTGEIMAAVFSEWRRHGSVTSGGLVWFAQDLWPGAGWGVLDARGRPKAALRVLARVLAPTALLAIDEGLRGLFLHAVHDGPEPLDAVLRVWLYQGEHPVREGERRLVVPSRGAVAVSVEDLLGGFADTTYAYRFGPPAHDFMAASLAQVQGSRTVAHTSFLPLGYPIERSADIGLRAELSRGMGDGFALTLATRRLAVAVHIETPGFTPDDDWFHMPPGGERRVLLVPSEGRRDAGKPPRGRIIALNAFGELAIPALG